MADEMKAGDPCKTVDNVDGTLVEQDGGLVCVAKAAEGGSEGTATETEGEEEAKKPADDSDKSHDDGAD